MESTTRKSQVARQVDSLAPKRLLYQILLMQVVYYVLGSILLGFYYLVSGFPFSITYVFSWEPVRSDTTTGWTLVLLWLLDTFFSVAAMTIIVGRSKLALDFTLTLHGINIIVTWLVSGKFPASWLWWGLQFASILLMVSLGTWTSQWRELRATFFQDYEMVPNPGTTRRKPPSPASSSPSIDQSGESSSAPAES